MTNKRIRHTLETFKSTVSKIHNNYYDYSHMAEYKGIKHKYPIHCPKHGLFYQLGENHLNGCGCMQCSYSPTNLGNRIVPVSTDKFISRAMIVHHNRYSYQRTEYVNNNEPVEIICPIHGVFTQSPHQHLRGNGCLSCTLDKTRKPLNEFIQSANQRHNNKYDYSGVEYSNNKSLINISCPMHGGFQTTPYQHLKGRGCQQCPRPNMSDTTTFITKAQQRHGNKYDYSAAIYHGAARKINIICHKHGMFSQIASAHLAGIGCAKCGKSFSKGEELIARWLDNHSVEYTRQKVFDTLVYKKKLKIDFYLPLHKILIEFDGRQHREPVNFCGDTEKALASHSDVRVRDSIKNDWAKSNDFALVRIAKIIDIDSILDNAIFGKIVVDNLFRPRYT